MKTKNFINFRSRKYGNSTCAVDGLSFHSRREADYYGQLKIEKRGKLILDFERQVSFELYAWAPEDEDKKIKIGRHIVDFLITLKDFTKEVREVKGFSTDLWDYKRKIFEANYPEIPYKIIK